jgi:hypothetical protein
VNVAATRGSLRVELQNAAGKPLPGFALTDCESIMRDGVALPVSWRRNKDLLKWAGQPVRMRFELQNCSFYGFNFA